MQPARFLNTVWSMESWMVAKADFCLPGSQLFVGLCPGSITRSCSGKKHGLKKGLNACWGEADTTDSQERRN